jgi:hypothetical protein
MMLDYAQQQILAHGYSFVTLVSIMIPEYMELEILPGIYKQFSKAQLEKYKKKEARLGLAIS